MNTRIQKHFHQILKHLYINPLEKCNLRCKICYTRRTDPILSEKEIINIIERYRKAQQLDIITFCGGEVFTLPYFTGLVNKLTSSEVIPVNPDLIGAHPGSQPDSGRTSFARMTYSCSHLIQIITNGTIDRLLEFKNPNMINLIVSIDGLRDYHDANRGEGNFDKSIRFLQKARKLGFHTEIFSIVTKQNYHQIDEFEKYLEDVLNRRSGKPRLNVGTHPESEGDPGQTRMTDMPNISVTYHPRKPPQYLLHHPVSNIRGVVKSFDFLDKNEMIEIMKNRKTFPPKDLGCYQIALTSDGKVYGCCEGTVPLGKMDDDIEDLINNLKMRLEVWEKKNKIGKCLGCSQPDFVCGIKSIIACI